MQVPASSLKLKSPGSSPPPSDSGVQASVLLPQTQESQSRPPPSNPEAHIQALFPQARGPPHPHLQSLSPSHWLLEPCNSASEFPVQPAQDRNTSSQSFTGSLPPDFGVWTLQPRLRTLGETKFPRFCLLKTRPPAPPSLRPLSPAPCPLKIPGIPMATGTSDRCGCYLRVEPEIAGGVRGWADGARPGASAAGPEGRAGGGEQSRTLRRHRGAGAGAARRQESARGPYPGDPGGKTEGNAGLRAETGAIPAGPALGARGRGSRVTRRTHCVPFQVLCPQGTLLWFSEPQYGPQSLDLSPVGTPGLSSGPSENPPRLFFWTPHRFSATVETWALFCIVPDSPIPFPRNSRRVHPDLL